MSLLNTLHIAHLPEDLRVYLSLYDEVKNAGFLQQQLLQGNSAFEYAFIDASIIAESFRRFGISPATTSLYAIKVSRTPSVNAATVQQHLSDSIEGKPLLFDESAIISFTDMGKVMKTYKLTDLGRSKVGAGRKGGAGKGKAHEDARLANGDNGGEEAERKELETMVLGLMALRGAT
ncbi:MAG: hypothetical protein Q9177_003562 [Variospora cf. flavescens]